MAFNSQIEKRESHHRDSTFLLEFPPKYRIFFSMLQQNWLHLQVHLRAVLQVNFQRRWSSTTAEIDWGLLAAAPSFFSPYRVTVFSPEVKFKVSVSLFHLQLFSFHWTWNPAPNSQTLRLYVLNFWVYLPQPHITLISLILERFAHQSS